MLCTAKELLKDASTRKYGVGMFNVVSLDCVRAVCETAEALKSPVMIALAEIHLPYAPIELMAPLMLAAARNAKVPVAVHLDHGCSFEVLVKAVNAGFTSVMFDGSTLPYAENLGRTKEIVKIASVSGTSVEAEIGHVGGGEGGTEDSSPELYTEPEQALRFAQESGIDSLAVAIGTVHGEFKKTPRLDFERLSAIHKIVSQPLVLHGGSGLSDDDFRECIRRGISKVNIFTDMSYAGSEAARKALASGKKMHCFEFTEASRKTMAEVVETKIRLFGSNGMA